MQNDEDVVRWKQSAAIDKSYPISFYRGAQLMQSTIQMAATANGTGAKPVTGDEIEVTPEMLTREYVQQLHRELRQLRQEVTRLREGIPSER